MMNEDDATLAGVLIAALCFGMIFAGVLAWSEGEWHKQVTHAQHNTYWYHQQVKVDRITSNISNSGATAAIISYYDLHGKYHYVSAQFPRKEIRKGQFIKAYVSKAAKIYIPIALGQNKASPYVAVQDWMPIGNIIFLGVFANVVLCALIGCGVYNILYDEMIFHRVNVSLFRRSPSLYGMKTLPKPRKIRLIHTSDGRLVEREYFE